MATATRIKGRPLTLLAVITTLLAVQVQGRPETNFASSSISSDGSGTRSSHLVGGSNNNGAKIYSGGTNGGGVAVVSGGGPGQQSGGAFTGSSTGGGNNGESVGIFSRTGPSGTQHTVITPQGTRTYNQAPGSGHSGVVAGTGSRIGGGNTGGGYYTYPFGSGYYNDHYNDDYYNNYNNNYPPPPYSSRPFGPGGAFAGAGSGTFAGAGAGAGAGGAFASAGGVGTHAGSGSPDYYG